MHLEVARDVSTDALFNANCRFVVRRGPVEHKYSDNGTNLVGTKRVPRQAFHSWNQDQICEHLRQEYLETRYP